MLCNAVYLLLAVSRNDEVAWRLSDGVRVISTSLEADRYTWLSLLVPPQNVVFIPRDLSTMNPYALQCELVISVPSSWSVISHPKSTNDMFIRWPAGLFITQGALERPQPLVSAW